MGTTNKGDPVYRNRTSAVGYNPSKRGTYCMKLFKYMYRYMI